VSLEPVIGLEIHCQLATRTKIFCGCRVVFGDTPNRHTCPVCLGWPGTLPVLNQQAVRLAIQAAAAFGCHVHPTSGFARKNYFYPDLPKGYQITQYDRPLATGGQVTIDTPRGERAVSITRIHLEEDAGKVLEIPGSTGALVDFNRAGIPLIEIVTGPELHSGEEARACFREIHRVVTLLGVCGGNLQQGHLRCDANVSLRRDQELSSDRVELKNLNSFRFLAKAIDHEIARQRRVIEAGGVISRETRLWDERTGRTVVMRHKEAADDYRYFPEPDLPDLAIDPSWIERARAFLPELPRARRKRLTTRLDVPVGQAEVLCGDARLADLFDATVAHGAQPRAAANWITGPVREARKARGSAYREDIPIAAHHLADLISLVESGVITSQAARTVFDAVCRTGHAPTRVVSELGLTRIDDEGALQPVVSRVLEESSHEVARYLDGKTKVLGSLVGKVLRATNGRADPRMARSLLEQALEKERNGEG